MVVAFSLFIKV